MKRFAALFASGRKVSSTESRLFLFASILFGLFCLLVAAWGRFGSLAGVPQNFTGAASYVDFALRFAEGRGPLDNGRPPGYPLLLAGEAWLAGAGHFPYLAVAVQMLLAIGVVWITHCAGTRIGGTPAWGFVAAALVASNLSLQFEFLAMRETCLYAFLALLTASSLIGEGPITDRRALIVGLLAAMCWLTRPTGLTIVGCAGVCVCLTRSWRPLPFFAAGLLLPVAVWCGYQVANHEEVHISGKSAQRTFFYSWHPALDVIYPIVDIDQLDPIVEATEVQWIAEGRNPGTMYRRESLRFIFDNPLRALLLTGQKAAVFFLPIQFPFADGEVVADGSAYAIRALKPLPLRGVLLGVTALFGVMGYFLALMRAPGLPRAILFVVGAVSLTALIHLATFAETRYRQPFDPALALVAVWAGAEHFRGHRKLTDHPDLSDEMDDE